MIRRYFPARALSSVFPSLSTNSDLFGFRSMGMGIARNAEKYLTFWQPHLDHCYSVQKAWVQDCKSLGTKLAILGAGRLNDCKFEVIEKSFERVSLYDADTNCLPSWKRLARKYPRLSFDFDNSDLTGVLAAWHQSLKSGLVEQEWLQALTIVQNYEARVQEALDLGDCSALISLNLLSQIPIMWQNIVENLLVERFGKERVRSDEEAWLLALSHSAKSLVRQHLEMLRSSRAREILLFTDLEYLYFSADSLPEVLASSKKPETLEGLCTSRMNALFGVDLENYLLSGSFFEQVTRLDSWTWFIQPDPRAEVYASRVGAFKISKP